MQNERNAGAHAGKGILQELIMHLQRSEAQCEEGQCLTEGREGSNESSCAAEVQLHRPHINDSLRNLPPQLFLLSCVISMLFSIFLA